jgi:hypothetical protein
MGANNQLRNTGFGLQERKLATALGYGKRFDASRLLMLRDWAGSNPVLDFLDKTFDTTNHWTVANGAGATTWAVFADVGGMIRGATGATAATSGLQLQYGAQKYYKGQYGAVLHCLLRLSAITELRVELGFVDALPAVNTSIINSLATPTFNTTAAGAVWVYDHTGSTTTMGLYGIGTGVAASKVAITAPAPVAATLLPVTVVLINSVALVFVGDVDVPQASVAIKNTDGLIPVMSVKGSDTTTKNVDLDVFAPFSGRLI